MEDDLVQGVGYCRVLARIELFGVMGIEGEGGTGGGV